MNAANKTRNTLQSMRGTLPNSNPSNKGHKLILDKNSQQEAIDNVYKFMVIFYINKSIMYNKILIK